MKRTIITLTFILMQTLVFGSIITVDNNMPSAGNYTSLQDAHDGAAAGDTLQVFPSPTTYNGINVTKHLTLIGVGYDLEDIPGQPENLKKTAKLTNMTFIGGSDNSLLLGFDGEFSAIIGTSNITIERNKLYEVKLDYSGISNIYINKNLLKKVVCDYNLDDTYNINILNNTFYDSNSNSIEFSGTPHHNNWMIINNVMMGNIYSISDDNTILFLNNIVAGIFSNYYFLTENDVIMYNIASGNELPEGNGNMNNVDLSTVFVDYANGDYHLAPGSPALGAGEGGVNMGAYGGDSPYVDNGIPAIPAIINFVSPYTTQQQNGLEVQITTKSNK